MKSVLIFSPSSVVRAGLASVIDADRFEIKGLVATREELEKAISEGRADLIIVDSPEADDRSIDDLLRDVSGVVVLSDDSRRGWLEAIPGQGRLPRNAEGVEISGALSAVAAGLIVGHPENLAPRRSVVTLPDRPRTRELEPLTSRETEVLAMLAEGLGNKEIARHLGISEHTVKFHVASILAKLDAESRTEAVTTGLRKGVITV